MGVSVISSGEKMFRWRLVGVSWLLFGRTWVGRRAGFRGDCHETFVVSRGRVVGDGGRAGVGGGVIRVADEGVGRVRRKCRGSCL